MLNQYPFLKNEYLGNSLETYVLAVGIFVGCVLFLRLIEMLVLKRVVALSQRTKNTWDDAIVRIVKANLMPMCYLAAFYLGTRQLRIVASLEKILTALMVACMTVLIVRTTVSVAILFLQRHMMPKEGSGVVAKNITAFIKIIAWGIGVVFVMDNLGFDVNAVIAGLGIGGVAVAFAAQAILGDLFNYFVIFFDRPFEVGDFVIVDDYMGVVRHIGIKTTRIESLGGEQVIFSNTDLTSSRIRNYKRMGRRRVLFQFGVTYQTSLEKLQSICGTVKQIIQAIPDTVMDRVHFKAFGASSLDFEVVYYVMGSDYNVYMDIQERINFALVAAFERDRIEFAYPTQTLYLNQQGAWK